MYIVGIQNGQLVWETVWSFLITLNIYFWSLPQNLGVYPGEVKNKTKHLCTHNDLYVNVYSGYICNHPKLETN